MPQTQFGLFDTPPGRNEIRLGLVLVGLLFAALAVLSALPDVRLRQIDAFIPIVDAIMFLGDIVTATLLFTQSTVFRSRALIVLASGFTFEALMLIVHALTFPGVFSPHGLLGAGLNTTAWIAYFWRAAPPIAVLLYVRLKQKEAAQHASERAPVNIRFGIGAAVVLALTATFLTIYGHDLLPQMFVNRRDLNQTNFERVSGATIALVVLALSFLYRNRKSVLDMWLLVALCGWLALSLLNIQATGRFTLNFYAQFSVLLFSHLVVMLALLTDSNRLHAKLALSTALRDEERDSRLMSMEAVAAAISHEVGQPVSAANMSASAALDWLSGARPNIAKAITSLEGAIDSGHRAFDVIKSIRTMFGRGGGAAIEFSLNELASETATLLQRDLLANLIEVEFELDSALPPVFADRVLMQRVLLNLFTNAIEAIAASKSKSRLIQVHSAVNDEGDILLEVSDTGRGIPPDDMPYIFNAFISTKSAGTGLGLSLCRAIVEEHGGKLWASQRDKKRGATFHLQLPRSEAAAPH